jgi:hypothetical protein
MRTGSETLLFFLQICGFAICGLIHQGNLRTCVLRINNYKFADCEYSICGLAHFRNLRFAKAEWAQEIADLQFADPGKKTCMTTTKLMLNVMKTQQNCFGFKSLILAKKAQFKFSKYTRLCAGNSWRKLHIIEKIFIRYLGNIHNV